MKPLGRHLTWDISGVARTSLSSPERMRALLHDLAAAGGATPLDCTMRAYAPQGVSGVLIIAESHITIHTWPEHGFAAVDAFTCGETLALDAMEAVLAAHGTVLRTADLHRGHHRGGPAQPPTSPAPPTHGIHQGLTLFADAAATPRQLAGLARALCAHLESPGQEPPNFALPETGPVRLQHRGAHHTLTAHGFADGTTHVALFVPPTTDLRPVAELAVTELGATGYRVDSHGVSDR